MCAKSYDLDSKCYVHSRNVGEAIPLCFNTIYYVENPDNEELNLLVQQCFSEDLNATLPRDLRKIPYRFHYLTQKELQADNLRKHLAKLVEDRNDLATDETINFLRECLYADTGGHLVARQLIQMSEKDDNEEHLITFPLLLADDKRQSIKEFFLIVAKADFHSISGVYYEHYYDDKYEWKKPQIDPNIFAVVISRLDIQKVDDSIQQALTVLRDKGIIKLTSDESINDTSDLLEKIANKIKDNKKIDKLYELEVDDKGNIFYKLSKEKRVKIIFGRGILPRALYILFLRQLERAINDPTGNTPKYICTYYFDTFINPKLRAKYNYKDELFAIYSKIKRSSPPADLRNTIDNYEKQEARNDITNINSAFEEIFYTDLIRKKNKDKHYTIDNVGTDSETRQILYAINLDKNDFDLGDFSIYNLKI